MGQSTSRGCCPSTRPCGTGSSCYRSELDRSGELDIGTGVFARAAGPYAEFWSPAACGSERPTDHSAGRRALCGFDDVALEGQGLLHGKSEEVESIQKQGSQPWTSAHVQPLNLKGTSKGQPKAKAKAKALPQTEEGHGAEGP